MYIFVYRMGRLCGGAQEISGIKATLFPHGGWLEGSWGGWVLVGWVDGWVGVCVVVGWVGLVMRLGVVGGWVVLLWGVGGWVCAHFLTIW